MFGPVLVILPYETDSEAVAIANDTPYGLAAYVSGSDRERLLKVYMSVTHLFMFSLANNTL